MLPSTLNTDELPPGCKWEEKRIGQRDGPDMAACGYNALSIRFRNGDYAARHLLGADETFEGVRREVLEFAWGEWERRLKNVTGLNREEYERMRQDHRPEHDDDRGLESVGAPATWADAVVAALSPEAS